MLSVGLPSSTAPRMESRLSDDGRSTASWFLGPALVFSVLAVTVSCHGACKHRVPSPSEVVHHVYLKPERLTKRSFSNNLQLKIKIIYDYSIDRLPADQRRLVKDKLFPQAIDYLQRAFSVRHRAGPVRLSRQCATNQYLRKRGDPHRYCQDACTAVTRCGPVVVPQHHLQQCKVCSESGKSCGPSGPPDGPGVEGADFVLYVSGLTTERCGQENIVAYAAYCQLEAELDRWAEQTWSSALVYSQCDALLQQQGLFAFYHDDEGKPLTPRFASGLPAFNDTLGLYQWSEAVIKRVSRLWDVRGGQMVRHHVHVLVTPRVVEEARRHFNCPILEGMELENQGGTGTELNHWEKRLLENEAMTGSHTQNRVFSRLTLAIMEDSGWYRANYSLAQRLDWGRRLGCDFVMKSCKFWMDQQRQRRRAVAPYCDTVRASPLQLTCRHDQLAVAVCNLQKFPEQLPPQFQYFDRIPDVADSQLPFFGGAVEIADFCPFSQEFSWHLSGEFQRSSFCRLPENQPDQWRNYGAEQYGPDSVCLYQRSAFVMEQCTRKMTYPDWGSGCYKVSCSGQGLVVFVQDRSFLCVHEGQPLSVSVRVHDWVYNGVLLCPACHDFCDGCPLPHQLPPINASRRNPIDPCSGSPAPVLSLLPLLAALLLCSCC
eukprot:XP_011617895.1 PREDICTED: leishmanolysin-like peptidase [Takifugu rubripes]